MEVTTIKSNNNQYFHSAKNIKYLPTTLITHNPLGLWVLSWELMWRRWRASTTYFYHNNRDVSHGH